DRALRARAPHVGANVHSRKGIRLGRRRTLFIVVALLLCAGVYLAPTPENLTREGQSAIAVFALCFVLWVTQALPLAVTSLFAIVLLPLLGAIPATRAFALFGRPVIFFILGAFILAAALMRCGLSTRLAVLFLRRFGSSPRTLLAGVIFSGGFLAFWMPEHAVAALLFPIVLEIARALDIPPLRSSYGKALFLALAWGAVAGGVATFLGGARAPLALGILGEHYGQTIGFLEWMIAVAPFSVVMMFVIYFALPRLFRQDIENVARARQALDRKARELGPVSRREKGVAIVTVATIVAWVSAGQSIGLAAVSMLSAVSLFVFNLIDWRSVEEYVNWGVILMYGGAIALAYSLHDTGGARFIAEVVLSRASGLSPYWLMILFAVLAAFLTEAISNVAAVALLLPICFGVAEGNGLSPIPIVFAVAVPAGLAFALPMGTPPNAIAYSAGYHRLRDSILAGSLLKVAALVLFALVARFYWPLLGIGG
ncbi:MAG: DASS family sodium-coupled anion symporter, partial [Candidatus Eisenbacteria bacterium]|nr:DASS family sodium-coupled anion symporter [Candidatus Eisenbacteria bacterium]